MIKGLMLAAVLVLSAWQVRRAYKARKTKNNLCKADLIEYVAADVVATQQLYDYWNADVVKGGNQS